MLLHRPIYWQERLLSLPRMASSQVSLPSSIHRPSIAASLVVISACLLPFLALPSSNFSANALFSSVADTFWHFLLGIVQSPRFYFFLLNFLIITLVCSSRILSPSPEPPDFEESPAGDSDQSDGYSAAHERLIMDRFYESRMRSLPYLRLFEGSNICTADEAQSDDRVDDRTNKQNGKHNLSLSLQGPTCTDVYTSDDNAPSALRAENITETLTFEMLDITNGSSMAKTLETLPGHIRTVNIVSADHQNFNADGHIVTDEMQISNGDDERDQEVGNQADGEKYSDAGQRSDGDNDNWPARHGGRLDALEEASTVDGGLDSEDYGNSIKELNSTLQTQDLVSQKTEERITGANEQAEDYDEDIGGALEENVDVDGGGKNEEEEDRGEAGEEKGEDNYEEGEIMSREELNKRVSAFITAFRRKHGYMEAG